LDCALSILSNHIGTHNREQRGAAVYIAVTIWNNLRDKSTNLFLLANKRAHMNSKLINSEEKPQSSIYTVAFWKHHPIADQNASALNLDIAAFYQRVPTDVIKLTPAGNYQVAERGGVAHWQQDILGRRSFTTRYVKSEYELHELAKLPEKLTDLEAQIVEAGRTLVIKNTRPVYATVFTPLTQLFMLCGQNQLVESILQSPQLVLTVLNKLTSLTRLLIREYIKAGITHFYLAMQHRASEILPCALYNKLGDTSDNELITFLQNELPQNNELPNIVVHVHGEQVYFYGLPNNKNVAIHYELGDENLSIETFCRQRQNELVVGLPLSFWENCTTDDLKKEIQAAAQLTGQNRIVFTAPCVVPLAIPEKSIAQWVNKFSEAISNLTI
tara:strand:+ start:1762 stop:2919 length:1158 start_codon:yes stop_codon:yes gene_type:complete